MAGARVRHLSQVASIPSATTPTAEVVQAFLTDLEQAGRSVHTRRAYASDLALLVDVAPATDTITPTVLRSLFTGMAHLAPSTRARRQASVASFTAWAFREELLDTDPMGRVARVTLDPPLPRGLTPAQVSALLASIPQARLRDRVLFALLATTGVRVGEALGAHVEDLTLDRDDERLTVVGKGGRRRTVLLDDPALVRLLRRYLRETGYRHGPLFRAERGTSSTPLRYQSIHSRWASYAEVAGIDGSIHDLRHGHAQALVNDGVSLSTIRKRLGHASVTTTQRYAELSDAVADQELRARQRLR